MYYVKYLSTKPLIEILEGGDDPFKRVELNEDSKRYIKIKVK